jgi:hypothetical protein
MRIPHVMMLALAMLSATAAARAQTYDPDHPVCMQIFGPFGHFDCSYASIAQCKLNASAQAAQCVINPYYARAHAAGPPARHRRHRHAY